MNLVRRLPMAFKTLRQLGPTQVGLYAWYQLGLRTGWLRRRTTDDGLWANYSRRSFIVYRPLFELPSRESLAVVLGEGASQLLAEADEITAGEVRLFGGEPVSLRLRVTGPLEHWTEYDQETGAGDKDHRGGIVGQEFPREDIKLVWELGRFGWAFTLARAYRLNGDERYAQAFWERLEDFVAANPAYLGPHWASAQEVAMRLMAITFASLVFEESPVSTPQRKEQLAGAIAAHATRIPPTLSYARAQKNNHLLSEAAGLYTAGLALPEHPRAWRWREVGWHWLNQGFQDQINQDGTYSQHSTNYHRLALQLALWAHLVSRTAGESFPIETQARLAAAIRWLLALVDRESGRVPNLGPNDGASIQPLSICPFADYRPVGQAAARAFLGEPAFPPGPWDEMSLWYLGDREVRDKVYSTIPYPLSPGTPHVLRCPDHPSWACFRVAQFTSRPGHADQLHLDLWWRGLNVARDAGTFQYNAPPPWQNALAGSAVHNTITVNGRDQMQRAGRFLWLDWAQGAIESGERGPDGAWVRLAASHDGYRQLGVIHRREVNACPKGRWIVEDRLSPVESPMLKVAGLRVNVKSINWNLQPVTARLHWLLPDWPWHLAADRQSAVLIVESPYGPVELRMSLVNAQGEDTFEPCDRSDQGARTEPGIVMESLDERLQSARRQRYRLNTGIETHPGLTAQVVRAGEVLYGDERAESTWGWVSPTYGVKEPALSIAVSVESTLPICLTSEWIFPPNDQPPTRRREDA